MCVRGNDPHPADVHVSFVNRKENSKGTSSLEEEYNFRLLPGQSIKDSYPECRNGTSPCCTILPDANRSSGILIRGDLPAPTLPSGGHSGLPLNSRMRSPVPGGANTMEDLCQVR